MMQTQTPPKPITVNVQMPAALVADLDALALRLGSSRSELIRRACRRFMAAEYEARDRAQVAARVRKGSFWDDLGAALRGEGDALWPAAPP